MEITSEVRMLITERRRIADKYRKLCMGRLKKENYEAIQSEELYSRMLDENQEKLDAVYPEWRRIF